MASEYLISTRDRVLEIVRGLSGPQWSFSPTPDSWSTAQVIEHLAIIEGRVHSVIANLPNAPHAGPDRINATLDEIILTEVPKRTVKIPAPPPVWPSGQWSPAEALSRFVENRRHTLELLTSVQCLRGRVFPHPILGELDGYQWILALAGHNARHIEQMLEVKACAGFPESLVMAAVSLH